MMIKSEPATPLERLLARGYGKLYGLTRKMPYGREFDRLYALTTFLHSHRRLPRRAGGFNDHLFFAKWDGYLDRDLVVKTTDKELAKEYIAATLGPDMVVPTLAILRSEADIDAYAFPDDCYVKGTASSNEYVLVRNGQVDRTVLKGWLRRTLYHVTRERNYRPLTQKLIVEPNIRHSPAGIFYDIRFYVYRGAARAIMLGFYDGGVPYRKFFDRHWTEVEIEFHRRRYLMRVDRPKNLDRLIAAAEALAAQFDLVRIDLYTNEIGIKVGEITHCPGNAQNAFGSKEDERLFSELIFGA